jgi:hypothetical protein
MEETTKTNGTNGEARSAGTPAPAPAAAAPVSLPSTVRELLGRVSVNGAPSSKKGANNATRWVMEVELGTEPLAIHLFTRFGKAIAIETLGISMAPLNAAYWEAKPFVSRDGDHGVVLQASAAKYNEVARFLLTIDAILPHELRNA